MEHLRKIVTPYEILVEECGISPSEFKFVFEPVSKFTENKLHDIDSEEITLEDLDNLDYALGAIRTLLAKIKYNKAQLSRIIDLKFVEAIYEISTNKKYKICNDLTITFDQKLYNSEKGFDSELKYFSISTATERRQILELLLEENRNKWLSERMIKSLTRVKDGIAVIDGRDTLDLQIQYLTSLDYMLTGMVIRRKM